MRRPMKLGTKGALRGDGDGRSRPARRRRAGPARRDRRRQEISLAYLEQLFAKLRRSGLVKSVRGPGGGYLLAHRPERDPHRRHHPRGRRADRRASRCRPGEAVGCRGDRSRCLTHDLWEELGNQIHLYLSSVSLADVCERRVLGTSFAPQRGSCAAQAPMPE